MEKIFSYNYSERQVSRTLNPRTRASRGGANEAVERQKRPLDPFLFVLAYRVHAKREDNSLFCLLCF